MVANFQPIIGQSATFQNHVSEALCTLFYDTGPTTTDTSFPLSNYCITHSLALLLRHCSCISLKVQIRFARTILANNLVEATISRDFQKVGHKLCSTAEGTISLAYPPLYPILSGPVVSSNIEGTGGEIVSHLEHGLLRSQALNSNFPKREGAWPCRGAWDHESFRERIEVWGPRFPRSRSRYRGSQDDQPRHVDHGHATLVCASGSTSPWGSRAGRQGRSRAGNVVCHQ